jgi:hypothetical protein
MGCWRLAAILSPRRWLMLIGKVFSLGIKTMTLFFGGALPLVV